MFRSTAKAANPLVQKFIAGSVGVTGLTASYLLYQDSVTASAMTAAEHGLHPPAYGWSHNGMFLTHLTMLLLEEDTRFTKKFVLLVTHWKELLGETLLVFPHHY